MTFVKTALFHKAGEGSGGGGGGDQHNLGWYATESALTTAHATATDGDWAIVGATDTVWVWDSDTTAWKDTGQAGIELPDQTGNSGKFLTTNGTSVRWGDLKITNEAHIVLEGSKVNIGNYYSSATGQSSVAIGPDANASGQSGVSIGDHSQCSGIEGVAVGSYAQSTYRLGVGIGCGAKAKAIGGIQLGFGENNTAGTFSVGLSTGVQPLVTTNYELLSADGTIPEARLADTTNAAQGQVLALDSNLDAVWTTPSGGGLPSQTGNAGKFLTTDGTDASWGDALVNTATQSGSVGIGTTNPVTTYHSVVIGSSAVDTSGSSIAIGEYAKADGVRSIIITASDSNYTAKANSIIIGGTSTPADHQIRVGNTTGGPSAEPGYGSVVLGTGRFESTDGASTGEFWVFLHRKSGIYDSPKTYKVMDYDGTIPTARLTKVNSTITLTAAGWGSNTQTVTVTGMTATGVALVSPDPTDQSAYTSAGILCTAQAADSLTFTCSTTPSADIDVNVVML